MSEETIAVVTTSGRAYYNIVSELKRRGLSFLSICPGDPIPMNIKVAITTASEKDKIHCSNILVYDCLSDPSSLVEKALQIASGKTQYREVIVGVDPGKRFGIAVLGDGKVLKIVTAKNVREAVSSIRQMIEIAKADDKIIRIGNGAGDQRVALITLLSEMLPPDVLMESVEENGTSKPFRKSSDWKRDLIDGVSAIRISMRNGQMIKSGRQNG